MSLPESSNTQSSLQGHEISLRDDEEADAGIQARSVAYRLKDANRDSDDSIHQQPEPSSEKRAGVEGPGKVKKAEDMVSTETANSQDLEERMRPELFTNENKEINAQVTRAGNGEETLPMAQELSPEQPTAIRNDGDGEQPTPLQSRALPTDFSNGAPTKASSPGEPDLKSMGSSQEDPSYAQDNDGESQSEIQSIMEQFDEEPVSDDGRPTSPGAASEEVTRNSAVRAPPRTSSLALSSPSTTGISYASHENTSQTNQSRKGEHPSGSESRAYSYSSQGRFDVVDSTSPLSPVSSSSIHKSLPPAPDPEPDLPFDFHRFLEQLRHRTADPVAKFLRSFLLEFGKKQWMVHEQVKIISDFLSFITGKMAQCEVWREVSDAEFDNAKEGMEKLVMNRLYSQTFSPAIPPPVAVAATKGKSKGLERQVGPGRRGQHQEDVERDEVLAQKVRIYGWTREQHLDIAPVGESGRRFLLLAQQELLKIKSYRAPRDKVICVLNCSKVIFGLLRHSKKSDTSADSFVPLLIYVVLQANPEHLVSNVQYILRFRNNEKLGGEAGYYLSSLMGAIQFIENLDRTVLTISDEDFEKNVEAAVSAIAERERDRDEQMPIRPQNQLQPPEKANLSKPEVTPRNSMEVERSLSKPGGSSESNTGEDKAAVTGLLRTIQRPLSSIGRIFSEDSSPSQYPGNTRPQQISVHPPETPRRLSPALFQPPRNSSEASRPDAQARTNAPSFMTAEDAAARQASAEAAEAQRIQRTEHKDVVETLASMFPNLDRDIIDDVVRMKEGRVGSAVDACLALNT